MNKRDRIYAVVRIVTMRDTDAVAEEHFRAALEELRRKYPHGLLRIHLSTVEVIPDAPPEDQPL